MFVRPHLDYRDILYDQTFNNFFHERLESIQYNAALAITSAIRSSLREKPGFQCLQQPSWYKKHCLFFKVIKTQSPKNLFDLIPTARQAYMIRHRNSVPRFNVKNDYFKNSFFPSTLIECNKLDSNIRNSESLVLFKKSILAFIRAFVNSTFQCYNPKGLKLITTLQL